MNAPGFLSKALSRQNIQSKWFYLNDYKNHWWKTYYGEKNDDLEKLSTQINNSTHLLIHNTLPDEYEDYILKNLNKKIKLFRHMHSLPNENPINKDTDLLKVKNDKLIKLSTLPTFHFYHYYTNKIKVLPNILIDNNLSPIKKNKFLGVIFSPTKDSYDLRNTFSSKFSKNLFSKLKSNAEIINNKNFFEINGIRKKNFTAVVDELHTYNFNRTSIEAMKNCCIAINNSSDISNKIFLNALNINENEIPFVRANEFNIDYIIDDIRKNYQSKYIFKIDQSFNFYKKWLNEKRMVNMWIEYLNE